MREKKKVSANTEGKFSIWNVRIKANVKLRNVDKQSSSATQSDNHTLDTYINSLRKMKFMTLSIQFNNELF